MHRAGLMVALAVALTTGCGGESEPDPHSEEGACGEIVDACHEVDTGTGEIAECHDLAHEGDAAACEPRRDECVALCRAAASDGGAQHHDEDAGHEIDGGASGDAGAPAHHDDGGTPELCRELGSLCHPYDTGSGAAHDCHELGHAGDLAACEAAEAMCRSVCSGDAGPHEP